MGMGERDLVRSEPLEGEVVPLALTDGHAAKTGGARSDQIFRRGPEHAQIAEDFGEITDLVVAHGANLTHHRGRGEVGAGSYTVRFRKGYLTGWCG